MLSKYLIRFVKSPANLSGKAASAEPIPAPGTAESTENASVPPPSTATTATLNTATSRKASSPSVKRSPTIKSFFFRKSPRRFPSMRRRRSRKSRKSAANTADATQEDQSGDDIAELKNGDRVDKWIILELIGEGSFGCVYKVGYHGDRYALKFDYGLCGDDKPLLVEKRVLELAKRAESRHICELFGYGSCFGFEYIVMTLAGRSLRDIVKQSKTRKLSAGCVISVGIQCVQAIEELHRIGFIHRDIKPANFATGRSDLVHGIRRIFLLDFGFCYQYVDAKDRVKHVKHDVSFKGTMRYAPIAYHRRKAPGRRDDLESWMYQQVEFTKGSLPWKHLVDEVDIMHAKKATRTKDGMLKLLRRCPKSYMDLLKYIGNLRHRARPDYEMIYKTLRKILFEAHLHEFPYDWEYQAARLGRR